MRELWLDQTGLRLWLSTREIFREDLARDLWPKTVLELHGD
jgi:hypothetical protein